MPQFASHIHDNLLHISLLVVQFISNEQFFLHLHQRIHISLLTCSTSDQGKPPPRRKRLRKLGSSLNTYSGDEASQSNSEPSAPGPKRRLLNPSSSTGNSRSISISSSRLISSSSSNFPVRDVVHQRSMLVGLPAEEGAKVTAGAAMKALLQNYKVYILLQSLLRGLSFFFNDKLKFMSHLFVFVR